MLRVRSFSFPMLVSLLVGLYWYVLAFVSWNGLFYLSRKFLCLVWLAASVRKTCDSWGA